MFDTEGGHGYPPSVADREHSSGSATPDGVRAEIAAWLADHWDPDLSLVDWRRRLVDAGWLVPTWPVEWFGRGLPGWAATIAAEEIRAAGAIGPPLGVGMALAAPTILEHGSDALRHRFLRRILTGEDSWCQLFSEPGAGSDLAGLTTTAIRDGDEWMVNGQKLWNTSADHADFGILVARTDWGVAKHSGLTFFVLPMRQDGVTVRPLRQMNRHSSFNEVFMTDARIPNDHVVGDPGSGWQVALTTLSHERRFGVMAREDATGGSGWAHEDADREAARFFLTYVWYPQRAGRADLLIEHARRQGRTADPVVRDAVAGALALTIRLPFAAPLTRRQQIG